MIWILLGALAGPAFLSVSLAVAQDTQPQGPVYIVQPGDSLWDISLRFGVSLDDLKRANSISDANQLAVGAQLVIPGLEGIQGTLITQRVGFGESLRSLGRRYGVSADQLARLNHLTSPIELFAGANLIVPGQNAPTIDTRRIALGKGQSLLEMAVLQHTNPWTVAIRNYLTNTWSVLPGDILRIPLSISPTTNIDGPGALPETISAVTVKPLPLIQGDAFSIQITGTQGMSISGSVAGRSFNFFPQNGQYIALQGIHALTEPGLYSIAISATLPEGDPFVFAQSVYLKGGGYPFDPVLTVSPETIDPAVTKPEDAEWTALAQPITPEKLWDGIFKSPVEALYSDCWPSLFGNRRSYNGSAYTYFHTGLDFCGGSGDKIFAPAAGVVVFAGPLTVRGNATLINHGWGVYTGYMHQSEILVRVGDRVEAGQEIGKVGGTGRVTGAHLHFEVWAGGVQVNPMSWLQRDYP